VCLHDFIDCGVDEFASVERAISDGQGQFDLAV
jgi:hypothetical protein